MKRLVSSVNTQKLQNKYWRAVSRAGKDHCSTLSHIAKWTTLGTHSKGQRLQPSHYEGCSGKGFQRRATRPEKNRSPSQPANLQEDLWTLLYQCVLLCILYQGQTWSAVQEAALYTHVLQVSDQRCFVKTCLSLACCENMFNFHQSLIYESGISSSECVLLRSIGEVRAALSCLCDDWIQYKVHVCNIRYTDLHMCYTLSMDIWYLWIRINDDCISWTLG